MELLRTKEAAEYLSISSRQFMRIVESGDIAFIPFGKSAKGYRFEKQDLDNYAKRKKRTSCQLQSKKANVVSPSRLTCKSAQSELDELLQPSKKPKS